MNLPAVSGYDGVGKNVLRVPMGANAEVNVSRVPETVVLPFVGECEADPAIGIHAAGRPESRHNVRIPRHDEHAVCIIVVKDFQAGHADRYIRFLFLEALFRPLEFSQVNGHPQCLLGVDEYPVSLHDSRATGLHMPCQCCKVLDVRDSGRTGDLGGVTEYGITNSSNVQPLQICAAMSIVNYVPDGVVEVETINQESNLHDVPLHNPEKKPPSQ